MGLFKAKRPTTGKRGFFDTSDVCERDFEREMKRWKRR